MPDTRETIDIHKANVAGSLELANRSSDTSNALLQEKADHKHTQSLLDKANSDYTTQRKLYDALINSSRAEIESVRADANNQITASQKASNEAIKKANDSVSTKIQESLKPIQDKANEAVKEAQDALAEMTKERDLLKERLAALQK